MKIFNLKGLHGGMFFGALPAFHPFTLSLSAVTEATEEVSLDSPERDVLLSDGPSPAITPITPPTSVITPRIGLAHDDMFTHSSFDEVTPSC